MKSWGWLAIAAIVLVWAKESGVLAKLAADVSSIEEQFTITNPVGAIGYGGIGAGIGGFPFNSAVPAGAVGGPSNLLENITGNPGGAGEPGPSGFSGGFGGGSGFAGPAPSQSTGYGAYSGNPAYFEGGDVPPAGTGWGGNPAAHRTPPLA